MLASARGYARRTKCGAGLWLGVMAAVFVCGGRAAERELIIPVAAQPLTANVKRLVETLEFLGAPLPADTTKSLPADAEGLQRMIENKNPEWLV